MVVISSIFTGSLLAQDSAEKLRKTREKTMKEIDYANKLLHETQGKTKKSLTEINIINHRLAKRKEFLIGLEVEVSIISQDIEKNLKEISATEQEIGKIKEVYARMILNLYKNKVTGYQSMYFVASENINQLYKRIHTVKLYNSYLKKEREKLDDLRLELQEKNDQLKESRNSKDVMVNKTKSETITIQREVNEKNQLIKQLKQRQKEIEEEIRNKEKIARKLENELKKIIDEERRASKAKGNKEVIMTPTEKIVSADFAKNIGKLPWPTERGIITGKYGEHQHPDYKNVTVRNDGVYISTSTGESARSIFKGVISRVFSIPGENYTVIIKHGQYFSLYHNLINVTVKPGQTVNTKEVIGTVFTDINSKETVLYFQIWKETERSDPEIWLAPL